MTDNEYLERTFGFWSTGKISCHHKDSICSNKTKDLQKFENWSTDNIFTAKVSFD